MKYAWKIEFLSTPSYATHHPLEFFGIWREKANIERCEQFDLCAFAAICCVNRKEVSILINFLGILRSTHPQ